MTATANKLNYTELTNNLQQFYGTGYYHKIGFTPIVATDGVVYFAEKCECFWLLDLITLNLFRTHQQMGALFLDIEVNKRHVVTITARQDKDMPVVWQKKQRDLCAIIPVGTYKIWLMDNVLLLPSEY